MSREAIVRTLRKDPGLVIHHNIKNEQFLLRDRLPKGASKGATAFVPKSKLHRQYAYFDQGATSGCTGYGSLTLCATADPYNKPPITGMDWYKANQEYDKRVFGYNFGIDGGATVTAAMEVGRNKFGFYSEYRWAYDIRTMQEAILHGALIAGTWWYDSMFDRDKEGIVIMPSIREDPVGGHLYCIRGYDAKRDLWICPNTWGDGDYKIPGDLMHRLVREEGEIAQPTEIKILDWKKWKPKY